MGIRRRSYVLPSLDTPAETNSVPVFGPDLCVLPLYWARSSLVCVVIVTLILLRTIGPNHTKRIAQQSRAARRRGVRKFEN